MAAARRGRRARANSESDAHAEPVGELHDGAARL